MKRPADGEYFASVAPGESIIPAGIRDDVFKGLASPQSGPREVQADVQVHLNLPNVKDGASFGMEVSKPDFLAKLTRAFEDMLHGNGIPTQTSPAGIP